MDMSAATSTMDMAMTTASSTMAMSTASSTAMSMTTTDTTMMGMDSMAMTFFTSTMTPLYSMSWMPSTVGQYAGTCIFLIAFAAMFRALLAVRGSFYQVMADLETRNNGGMTYEVYKEDKSVPRPWKAREAMLLGVIDVILAGVGYLLMIAVMTMNVGYFLSVLAGVFVGSVVFSRFIGVSGAH